MNNNVFTPKKVSVGGAMEDVPTALNDKIVSSEKVDQTESMLNNVVKYAIVLFAGLLPVFFTVGLWAGLHFDKVFLTVSVISIVAVVGCLSLLRRKEITTIAPLSLGFLWLLAIVSLISGAMTGDSQDAWRGSFLEVQTAGFMFILALTASIPLVLQASKKATSRALFLFLSGTLLILVYNLLRIVFGENFITLGSFSSQTI